MKINCVVVTYNRLDLLKENIEALLSQTYKLNKIIILDNNSDDGTLEYLEEHKENELFKIIRLEKNIGGAGGFSYGIKCAIEEGCDWVWIMDDDTIPTPNALENLLKAKDCDNVGYICSKVIWKDETPHHMNIPLFSINKGDMYINHYSGKHPFFLINHATFVSLLIKSEAVMKVGLPIKEFFIWHDDIEYTSRISKNGYCGIYVDNSIVVHKTNENYKPHLDVAPADTAWKFYYQVRNTIFLKRKKTKNPILFWLSLINKYRRCMRKINNRKDSNKKIFKDYVNKGFIDGIKFSPSIEYIDK